MTISADAILTYILIAVGGFLVKVILDWFKQTAEEKNDKAKRFEEQNGDAISLVCSINEAVDKKTE